MTRDDIRELTDADFARSIPRRLRDRLMRGELKSGAARHPRVLRENLALAG